MAYYLIKTIKHGIRMPSTTPKNVDYWDEQLAKVMFGYRCRIHTNIKLFPLMIMIGHTPSLKVDNYLHSLTTVINDIDDEETIVE